MMIKFSRIALASAALTLGAAGIAAAQVTPGSPVSPSAPGGPVPMATPIPVAAPQATPAPSVTPEAIPSSLPTTGPLAVPGNTTPAR